MANTPGTMAFHTIPPRALRVAVTCFMLFLSAWLVPGCATCSQCADAQQEKAPWWELVLGSVVRLAEDSAYGIARANSENRLH
jgi:hypothetical protein